MILLPDVMTHGTNARWISARIRDAEAIIRSIQWMYRIVDTSKVERYVQVLAAGHGPVLTLNVIFSTLNTSIDCIRNITRNLAMKIAECSSI